MPAGVPDGECRCQCHKEYRAKLNPSSVPLLDPIARLIACDLCRVLHVNAEIDAEREHRLQQPAKDWTPPEDDAN